MNGSAFCWPGLLSATAANPPPIVPGLSVGDTVTLTFSKATNQPSFPFGVLSAVSFSPPIATAASYYWTSGGTSLVIRVMDITGIDTTAAAVSGVTATLLASAGIQDAQELSPAARNMSVGLTGTWGAYSAPQILSATAINVLVPNGEGSANSSGFSGGDRIRLQFDQLLFPLSLMNTSLVASLVSFFPRLPVGTETQGQWVNSTTLDIVFTSVPALTPSQAVEYAVGVLNITILPSGGLTSLDRESPPSNATVIVTSGSWGDPATGLLLEATSTSALIVTGPPIGALQYTVTWYLIRWAINGNFTAFPDPPNVWPTPGSIPSNDDGTRLLVFLGWHLNNPCDDHVVRFHP